MKHEKEMQVALELAKRASEEIRRFYFTGFKTETKTNNTPVTEADKLANRIILEGLIKAFPKDGIISEEMDSYRDESYRLWHVDPIDGTRSFVSHSDTFAVHIGLAMNGEPVLGVVHKPLTDESYIGIVGEGAWRLHPYGRQELKIEGDLPGTIAVMSYKWKDYRKQEGLFQRIGVTGYISSGSAGLRTTKIVENQGHFIINDWRCHSWDLVAPDAILRATGGVSRFAEKDTPTTYWKTGPDWKGKMPYDSIFARDEKTMEYVQRNLLSPQTDQEGSQYKQWRNMIKLVSPQRSIPDEEEFRQWADETEP